MDNSKWIREGLRGAQKTADHKELHREGAKGVEVRYFDRLSA